MIDIQIIDTPISLSDCMQSVTDESCGAIATFTGTVRNATQNKKVVRLEYECYHPMAMQELKALSSQAIDKFDIQHICIHHRTGALLVGDIAVYIAVSAVHRADAFAACQFAIDQLKQQVPIWKKEVFEDGTQWVAAHA